MRALCASIALVVLFCGPAFADLDTGLVGFYPFNGDARDESGNGNDGIVDGATLTTDRHGEPDRAYYFDGASTIVTSNLFGVTGLVVQPFTVSAWFQTDSLKDRAGIVNQWYTCGRNPRHFSLIFAFEKLQGEVFSAGAVVGDRYAVTDGEWHHVVLWRSTTEMRLYVDSVLVASSPMNAPTSVDIQRPVVIGGLESDSNCDAFFEGKIDDVRVYDRALSVSDLEELFCTDLDNDGFCAPHDCDDDDPLIHPGAIEFPGNFVDENCDGNLGDCDPCAGWKNHGQYVRCVAHAAEDLVDSGLITQEEGDALVSSAASSDVGKKGYSPPECE